MFNITSYVAPRPVRAYAVLRTGVGEALLEFLVVDFTYTFQSAIHWKAHVISFL
jgi:hypothetical protein